MPKLSIITINYNDVEGLKKTLQSVEQQTSCDFQHVIVDGASSDGSKDIIEAYANRVKFDVKWVSEPDKGIYNAMNKGICMAEGEYIEILNSADMLVNPQVVNKMLSALSDNHFPDIMYGNMISIDSAGKITGKSGYTEYSLRNYYSGTLNHNCAYIRRELFDAGKYGLYDESYKIVSDWKWYLQVIGLGYIKPVYVDIDVTFFDTSGISSKNLTLRNLERRKVLEQVVPPAILWDYDNHAFDAVQMNRLRRYHLYPFVNFIERVLFKLEKWKILKP